MIGIFLIYFIGKAFYELAHEHNKSRWGFAILGVVSYYAGTFIAGLIFAIASEIWQLDFFNETNEIALGFVALPFGLLACWGLYKILQNQWIKKGDDNNDSLDSDLVKPSNS